MRRFIAQTPGQTASETQSAAADTAAAVKDGLPFSLKEAQTQQDTGKSEVYYWLKGLGY